MSSSSGSSKLLVFALAVAVAGAACTKSKAHRATEPSLASEVSRYCGLLASALRQGDVAAARGEIPVLLSFGADPSDRNTSIVMFNQYVHCRSIRRGDPQADLDAFGTLASRLSSLLERAPGAEPPVWNEMAAVFREMAALAERSMALPLRE